jgi:TPP-dependent pyruvate/acetoin dehydrogenase alpha subunit
VTSRSLTSLDGLEALCRIRIFEEQVRDLAVDRQVIGSVHLCIGQEAIPVGVCAALEPRDAVFATYRGHGWALGRGVRPEAMFAELLGRATGTNGGRGGSAYLSSAGEGFYGENSIVAGSAPIAVGAALAAKFDGTGRVAVVAFGDGALNQGAMHEAMNFASAFALPVVFVCENNLYSELTPIADMVADPNLWHRAGAYAMPGVRVDGNEVEAVRTAAVVAVDRARSGGGPSLIEAMTERLVGHYIGDVEQYRPAGEVDRAREREPIVRLTEQLVALGVSAEVCAAANERALATITQARVAALAAPPADVSLVGAHLYA